MKNIRQQFLADCSSDKRKGLKSRGILFFLPKSWHKYFYVPDVVKFKGVKEIFYVRNFHLNPFNNENIVNACLRFLKHGKF